MGVMMLRSLAACLFVTCAAAVAQAGAVYGTNAVSNYSSPIQLRSGTDADMDGPQDGAAAAFRNNSLESGAQQFTVLWDVTGAEDNIKWRLFLYNRSTPRTEIVGVTLYDDAGLTAVSTNSLVVNTGPVTTGTITLFELVGFQTRSDYGTVDTNFDWNNVEGLLITFQLDNPIGTGARTPINIDAVANPEPTTLALFGLGVLGLGAVARRRRRAARRTAG